MFFACRAQIEGARCWRSGQWSCAGARKRGNHDSPGKNLLFKPIPGDFHEIQSCKSTCLFRFVRGTLFKTDLIIEGQKDKI